VRFIVAPRYRHAETAGVLEDLQVLGDGLLGDVDLLGDLADQARRGADQAQDPSTPTARFERLVVAHR